MTVNPEILKGLETWAEAIRQCSRVDPQAQPIFDLMSGGLVWPDEAPEQVKAVWALRPLWNYRMSLLLGEPPGQREAAVWNKARELFPEWIGFSPDRCIPTPELSALAREHKRKGDREIDKFDRLSRRQEWRKAHGGGKP